MDTLLERLVGLLHTFKAGEAGEEDGGDGGERKVAFGAAPALRSTSHGAVLKQVNRLFVQYTHTHTHTVLHTPCTIYIHAGICMTVNVSPHENHLNM